MSALTTIPAVRLGETTLTLHELIRREHRAGRLLPWLRQAVLDAYLLDQARAMGVRSEPGELQRTADLRRRHLGLLSAEQTNAWLAEQKLTLDDFEAGLETELLLGKLRRQVSEGPAQERFRSRPRDYDRLQLRLIVVPREELAREILTQIEEEGADLAALARQHSQHAGAATDGLLDPVFRVQLSGPLREALETASAGELLGPIAEPSGFVLVRIEQFQPAELNAATATFLLQEAFSEWLNERLAQAPFVVPLLDTPV